MDDRLRAEQKSVLPIKYVSEVTLKGLQSYLECRFIQHIGGFPDEHEVEMYRFTRVEPEKALHRAGD